MALSVEKYLNEYSSAGADDGGRTRGRPHSTLQRTDPVLVVGAVVHEGFQVGA